MPFSYSEKKQKKKRVLLSVPCLSPKGPRILDQCRLHVQTNGSYSADLVVHIVGKHAYLFPSDALPCHHIIGWEAVPMTCPVPPIMHRQDSALDRRGRCVHTMFLSMWRACAGGCIIQTGQCIISFYPCNNLWVRCEKV